MNRVKALYRSWSIPCAGTQVYAPRYREQWLGKIEHAGVRRRAELLYQQLDGLQALRRTLRPEVLAESQVVMPRWWPIGSRDARVRGRVSMHSLGVRGAVTQHRVSGWILCPLG